MFVLETKPDTADALNRFEAWWQCENEERPLITVSVPSDPLGLLPTKHYETPQQAWFDFDFRIERALAEVKHGTFLAETFPCFEPNMGPDVLSCLFGLQLDFAPSTSWGVPFLERCEQILEIQPDFSAPEWVATEELIRRGIEAGRGKWITLFTDLHGNADILSALLGPEATCMEFLDEPDTVRKAIEHVTTGCRQAYRRQIASLMAEGLPISCWIRAFHQGASYAGQADFSAMVSPEHFAEAILPSVIEEMADADRVIYHLDGEDALRHLDLLLEVPKIDAIQWVYGAGHGPALRWEKVYKQILSAGKAVKVECETFTDALALHERLGNRGVWYNLAAPDREQAEWLIGQLS